MSTSDSASESGNPKPMKSNPVKDSKCVRQDERRSAVPTRDWLRRGPHHVINCSLGQWL